MPKHATWMDLNREAGRVLLVVKCTFCTVWYFFYANDDAIEPSSRRGLTLYIVPEEGKSVTKGLRAPIVTIPSWDGGAVLWVPVIPPKNSASDRQGYIRT